MDNRTQLIRLIHVAKRQLRIEDSIYRTIAEDLTGKTSSKDMSISQLHKLLDHFKAKGFKVKPKAKSNSGMRMSPKTSRVKVAEVTKIRAIWITMHEHGFVRDGSETALDAYVRRMTLRNKGEGVDHVAWMTSNQAYGVLEALKNWHRRKMVEALLQASQPIPLTDLNQIAGYDRVCEVYDLYLNSLQEQS